MRKASLVLGLVLVAAACGGSDEPATPTSAADVADAASGTEAPQGTSTTTTEATTGDTPGESTTSTADAGPSFDGPPAPDFELTLSDGSTFRLSDEQKPVYMVFWAEW